MSERRPKRTHGTLAEAANHESTVGSDQRRTGCAKIGLQFEKDSLIFFLGMQDATCEGNNRDMITLLMKEEQTHVRRLSLQMQKMGYCRM